MEISIRGSIPLFQKEYLQGDKEFIVPICSLLQAVGAHGREYKKDWRNPYFRR